MLKVFPIDFVRQALEQKLLEQHLNNVNVYGGKNQVSIHSFYEQLKSQDEVDRFVETYRDLSDQQNRTGLILNGVLVSPENPTYTNLYSCTIVPLTWTCSLRCMLENRDNAIITINNLIEQLKGKKVDIAQLNGVDANGNKISYPFMVGTIGQNPGTPTLKNGDFIPSNYQQLYSKGVVFPQLSDSQYMWFYRQNGTQLKVVKAIAKHVDIEDENYGAMIQDNYTITVASSLIEGKTISDIRTPVKAAFYLYGATKEVLVQAETETINEGDGTVIFVFTFAETLSSILGEQVEEYDLDYIEVVDKEDVYDNQYELTYLEDDGTYNDIIFPPTHESFDKYKLSLSFDAIRCDEPRNLNEREYCELTFGGSATLVNEKVKLGNDLLKVSFSKLKIVASSNINFTQAPIYYLEPLELPSGNNANTQINQLVSNKFKTNSHTDSFSITLQYSFILDESIDLLKQWFNYARYGTQGVTVDDISPNMIYTTNEYWCSWGVFENISVPTKLVENIDIENTESDTLTLGVSMQVQGENN